MSNEITQSHSGAMVPADTGNQSHVATLSPSQAGRRDLQNSQANISQSVALSAEDQPIAAEFVKAMGNTPREYIDRALRWYAALPAKLDAATERSDEQDLNETRNAMRSEWGHSYIPNLRAIKQLFASLPPGVQQALETAELADGTLLLNTPTGLRWLFDLARRPVSYGSQPHVAADEIAQIENIMRTDRRRYNNDERMQARYRDLVGGR